MNSVDLTFWPDWISSLIPPCGTVCCPLAPTTFFVACWPADAPGCPALGPAEALVTAPPHSPSFRSLPPGSAASRFPPSVPAFLDGPGCLGCHGSVCQFLNDAVVCVSCSLGRALLELHTACPVPDTDPVALGSGADCWLALQERPANAHLSASGVCLVLSPKGRRE